MKIAPQFIAGKRKHHEFAVPKGTIEKQLRVEGC
jgi:hypothetical protein